MQNDKKLKKVLAKFVSSTFFVPVIGAEIEFYKDNSNRDDILSKCHKARLKVIDVLPEKGKNQWEVSFQCTTDLVKLCEDINRLKTLLSDASFSALPYEDDHGNALHIHISLFNCEQKNIFEKEGDDETIYMKHAIGGLLKNLNKNIDVFAPTQLCKERLFKGEYTPKTVSWGGNNRTVALRIPTTTIDPFNRRIEHRVSSAESDHFKVIIKILEAIQQGLLEEIEPESEKIYGDASLDIYNLPKIVK